MTDSVNDLLKEAPAASVAVNVIEYESLASKSAMMPSLSFKVPSVVISKNAASSPEIVIAAEASSISVTVSDPTRAPAVFSSSDKALRVRSEGASFTAVTKNV